MAYDPEDGEKVMKELMKPLDRMIMMCDDKQDLYALASILLVTAKGIFLNNLGRQKTLEIFRAALKDFDDGR